MTNPHISPFDMFKPAPALGGGSNDAQKASQDDASYLNPHLDPLTVGLDDQARKQREAEQEERQRVYGIRSIFFHDLLLAWANPPNHIDQLMGQDRTYIAPDFATHRHDHPRTVKIFDVANGVLAASVTPPVSDLDKGNLRWTYSIWQAGDWLRFGVLIQGETRYLVEFDNQHDNVLGMERVWDRNADFLVRGPHGLLLEWRFKQPEIYTDFIVRERFVMVARHLHFRLSAMIDALSRKIASGDFESPLPQGVTSEYESETFEHSGPFASLGTSASELSLDGLSDDGSWNIPDDDQARPDNPGVGENEGDVQNKDTSS